MQVFLTVGPLTIAEPATAITDYVMAGLALSFAIVLGRRASEADHAKWWSLAFAFLAASALAGGTHHGLQWSLPPRVVDALWRATIATAAASSFAVMRAAALQWLGSGRSAWASLATAKLVISLLAGAWHPDFLVVVADFGCTVLFAVGAGIVGRARHPRAFPFLAGGAVLFAAGAAIQQSGFDPHLAFNHNDLFHVIQILGNTSVFLSARSALFRGRTSPILRFSD